MPKKRISEDKKLKEKAWYKHNFEEKEPEFKPLKRTGEIAYVLDKNTTVFAPPGADIKTLKAKYNIK